MPRYENRRDTLLGETEDDITFIVATEHLPTLLSTTDPIAEGPLVVGESDAILGLTQVRVPDVARIAAGLTTDGERQRPGLPPSSDMEVYLDAVRRAAAERYRGWEPLLGQSRLMRNVAGLPHVSPGGDGVPEPVDPPLSDPPAPATGDLLTGPVVGLLDSQMVESSALAGRYLIDPASIWRRGPGEPPRQFVGHALFGGGLITRQAPTARLFVSSVLDEASKASCWTVARELVRLDRAGVDVLVCPLGCYTLDGRPPLLLARAVEKSKALIVAAAGNHWTADADDPQLQALPRDAVTYPAGLDSVVAVAAAGSDPDGLEAHSARSYFPWVDVTEAGEDVTSTFFSGPVTIQHPGGKTEVVDFHDYAKWSGTSFAAGSLGGRIAAHMAAERCSAHEAYAAIKDAKMRAQDGPRTEG